MSLEIWPPISEEELKIKEAEVQMLIDPRTGRKKRELEWMINEVRETLRVIKHGLEDCYALLAPIEPGSTLVMSTQRNERIKGHITRVGTRIVKGTIHLQLRTLPTQSITIDPEHPIHVAPLARIHTQLTECIDMLGIFLGMELKANFISAQLRVLATAVSECSALLKGPPLTDADPLWTNGSCSPGHFTSPVAPNISLYLGLQDSSLVLWLRALEPADIPVHFGMKLGLAIGTVRRLEHDEMDQVFKFSYPPHGPHSRPGSSRGHAASAADSGASKPMEVYVREKVRVESADPSLMSVSAKLNALGHTIAQVRANLAAVMGEELDE